MKTTYATNFNHAADLKALSNRLTTIDTGLQMLGKSPDIKRIIEMIKIRPGWTTPAEFAFANALSDSINEHMKTLQTAIQNFAKGADLVKEG